MMSDGGVWSFKGKVPSDLGGDWEEEMARVSREMEWGGEEGKTLQSLCV